MIISESIIPALPLSVFITLNIASYGNVVGFLISWLSTIVGCMLSFTIFRHFFQKRLYSFTKKKDLEKVDKIMKNISDMDFSNLVILIAMPFSPAFLINIAGGLSKIIIPLCHHDILRVENLTLYGLLEIYKKNINK